MAYARGGRRLTINGWIYPAERPLVNAAGAPIDRAVVWSPQRCEGSLLPGVSRWSDVRTTVRIPLWCAALPFAAFAIATERAHRLRLRREQAGNCPRCRYNRAGLPRGAPCPECGTN